MKQLLAAFLACGLAMGAAGAAGQVRVVGTSLSIAQPDGSLRSGPSLAGSEFTLADGQAPRRFRIESVRPDGRHGITWHRLALRDAQGRWRNVCQPDRQGGTEALFLEGRHLPDARYVREPGRVSIACGSGVQAKCLRAGYLPWDDSRGTGLGLKLFQACTRMFRADYCGDGVAWTVDGMAIDFFDAHGIEKPEDPATMPLEAAWDENGALCVHHTRVRERIGLDGLARLCPRLAAASNGPACTEQAARAWPGALLFNRSADGP